MTMFGRVVRLPAHQPVRRERWELADGDFLDLDYLDAGDPLAPSEVEGRDRLDLDYLDAGDPLAPSEVEGRDRGNFGPRLRSDRTEASAPLVIVLHGLEGSSRASYVRGLAATARAAGLSSCALNFRGCSGTLNRLPRFYHSGETGDLAALVERLAAEEPGRSIGLVGFSLGGNVVAKYLGERGDSVPRQVRAAAVISVPFDLAGCARALDGPSIQARIYRGLFIRSLRAKAVAKARKFPQAVDAARAARARTFAEIDDWFTAPLHGFAGAEDYWRRCSSGPLLGGVRRPLLALSAYDDPFVPGATLPVETARGNPLVTLEITPRGGHLAFVSGPPWAPERWAERAAVAFLREQL
jgi:predicted alpha/beta-fold hydrolase